MTPPGSFVSHGGQQCYAQPFVLNDVRFYGFVLDAELSALRDLCERLLNAPSGGAVWYTPLAPWVMLGVADIAAAHSQNPPDSNAGCMTEVDAAFWVPIVRLKPFHPSLLWFMPYVFVNNGWALVSGREVFGFLKELAEFVLPRRDSSDPARFSISTMLVRKYGPRSAVETAELLELKRLDSTVLQLSGFHWSDPLAFFGAALKNLGHDLTRLEIAEHQEALPEPLSIHGWHLPLAFLKQIRSVTNSQEASYQSIVEAPAELTKFRGAGLLHGSYQLTVTACDSHPIAADLGLGSSPMPVRLGVYADYDFVMKNGIEIWRA
jgi:hypothetical protein